MKSRGKGNWAIKRLKEERRRETYLDQHLQPLLISENKDVSFTTATTCLTKNIYIINKGSNPLNIQLKH